MPTTTAPLSASILYRNLQKTIDLLEAAAKEWAERAQRNEQLSDESASLLDQMVRLCLRSPDMMRDLWEWTKAEEIAGRLQERDLAGDYLRERMEAWLQLVDLLQPAASACEAQGRPISGADELAGAANELRAILQEVEAAWPRSQPSSKPALGYDELRTLAERFTPPGDWYEEKDDLF